MMRRTIAIVLGVGVLLAGLGGCSGGGGGGSGAPPTGNLNISGRVVSAVGFPLANVVVWISGNGPFTTDADGEFTALGMPSPYEAVVVEGSVPSAEVWSGLTLSNPVFTSQNDISSPPSGGAMIDGTVSGGVGFPVPATHTTEVKVVIEDGFGASTDPIDATTGDYDFSAVSWLGPPVTGAKIVAFQYLEDANGNPLTFTGFGSLDIPALTLNSVLTNQDIAMAPVPTTNITGTLNLPTGLSGVNEFVILRPSTGGFISLAGTANYLPSFSIFAPVVAGVARDLLILVADVSQSNLIFMTRENLPDPAMNLDIIVPDPTGLVLPVDGVTGVTHDTVFHVTPTPGGRVFTIRFIPQGLGPVIRVHTMASSVTIPDLSAYGIVIPPAAGYSWSVLYNGPIASLDEAAVTQTIVFFAPFVSNGTSDAFVGGGEIRDFTFAP